VKYSDAPNPITKSIKSGKRKQNIRAELWDIRTCPDGDGFQGEEGHKQEMRVNCRN
jgi:hypothetical protein